MNRVIMSGRLVAEWETKGGATQVGKNRIAVDKLNGEPFFVSLTAFGKTAEIAEKYTKKGHKIFIEGRLEINKFEEKYFTEVIVERIEFMQNIDKKEHSDKPAKSSSESKKVVEDTEDFPF